MTAQVIGPRFTVHGIPDVDPCRWPLENPMVPAGHDERNQVYTLNTATRMFYGVENDQLLWPRVLLWSLGQKKGKMTPMQAAYCMLDARTSGAKPPVMAGKGADSYPSYGTRPPVTIPGWVSHSIFGRVPLLEESPWAWYVGAPRDGPFQRSSGRPRRFGTTLGEAGAIWCGSANAEPTVTWKPTFDAWLEAIKRGAPVSDVTWYANLLNSMVPPLAEEVWTKSAKRFVYELCSLAGDRVDAAIMDAVRSRYEIAPPEVMQEVNEELVATPLTANRQAWADGSIVNAIVDRHAVIPPPAVLPTAVLPAPLPGTFGGGFPPPPPPGGGGGGLYPAPPGAPGSGGTPILPLGWATGGARTVYPVVGGGGVPPLVPSLTVVWTPPPVPPPFTGAARAPPPVPPFTGAVRVPPLPFTPSPPTPLPAIGGSSGIPSPRTPPGTPPVTSPTTSPRSAGGGWAWDTTPRTTVRLPPFTPATGFVPGVFTRAVPPTPATPSPPAWSARTQTRAQRVAAINAIADRWEVGGRYTLPSSNVFEFMAEDINRMADPSDLIFLEAGISPSDAGIIISGRPYTGVDVLVRPHHGGVTTLDSAVLGPLYLEARAEITRRIALAASPPLSPVPARPPSSPGGPPTSTARTAFRPPSPVPAAAASPPRRPPSQAAIDARRAMRASPPPLIGSDGNPDIGGMILTDMNGAVTEEDLLDIGVSTIDAPVARAILDGRPGDGYDFPQGVTATVFHILGDDLVTLPDLTKFYGAAASQGTWTPDMSAVRMSRDVVRPIVARRPSSPALPPTPTSPPASRVLPPRTTSPVAPVSATGSEEGDDEEEEDDWSDEPSDAGGVGEGGGITEDPTEEGSGAEEFIPPEEEAGHHVLARWADPDTRQMLHPFDVHMDLSDFIAEDFNLMRDPQELVDMGIPGVDIEWARRILASKPPEGFHAITTTFRKSGMPNFAAAREGARAIYVPVYVELVRMVEEGELAPYVPPATPPLGGSPPTSASRRFFASQTFTPVIVPPVVPMPPVAITPSPFEVLRSRRAAMRADDFRNVILDEDTGEIDVGRYIITDINGSRSNELEELGIPGLDHRVALEIVNRRPPTGYPYVANLIAVIARLPFDHNYLYAYYGAVVNQGRWDPVDVQYPAPGASPTPAQGSPSSSSSSPASTPGSLFVRTPGGLFVRGSPPPPPETADPEERAIHDLSYLRGWKLAIRYTGTIVDGTVLSDITAPPRPVYASVTEAAMRASPDNTERAGEIATVLLAPYLEDATRRLRGDVTPVSAGRPPPPPPVADVPPAEPSDEGAAAAEDDVYVDSAPRPRPDWRKTPIVRAMYNLQHMKPEPLKNIYAGREYPTKHELNALIKTRRAGPFANLDEATGRIWLGEKNKDRRALLRRALLAPYTDERPVGASTGEGD